MVGYFINAVVIRSKVNGDEDVPSFLDRVHQTIIQAMGRQEFPFPLIVEHLKIPRDTSRSAVFQVCGITMT